ncbi:MAG: hypothetical protein IGR80_04265 [Synechococcales cyanobacterium K44_A2020_017]|jgi:hypothetical protein|uniref:hypothetical protein n=1 Tax=Leptolyngbya sp. CCY15150 TaxID=2767772 RepID=UPI00194FF94E|nr:hypothetical protein [Leptolyngbya sp. CCY15150]MBF2089046.1 hypothetical protein [Synechococcales cyanobacterium K32_A2020_035]MBF2093954.1 hypothetical protein [Synechococcales cyanobacterium K44_A2020_017]
MSVSFVLVSTSLAQTPEATPSGLLQSSTPWMISSGLLLVLLVAGGVVGKRKLDKIAKQKRFEEFKNRELQKKLRLALQTISKMERNPDLIHSREFNLDYLRMRMEEEQFKFAIVNQIKIKVKEKISVALRPTQSDRGGIVGIASGGRLVDEIFDVEYNLHNSPKKVTRVLFRIQIKLTKLPTQPTSETIRQIIDCLAKFMSPGGEADNWQPVIQSKIATLHWDQKAKPTPLLVLEQLHDGANVTYRTTRMATGR